MYFVITSGSSGDWLLLLLLLLLLLFKKKAATSKFQDRKSRRIMKYTKEIVLSNESDTINPSGTLFQLDTVGLSLICFFFLPIMLFGNAQFFTDYAQNYARFMPVNLQESLYNNIN